MNMATAAAAATHLHCERLEQVSTCLLWPIYPWAIAKIRSCAAWVLIPCCRSAGYLATASSAAGDDQSQGPVLNGALVWPLEQLAQQHGAHELLYHACELLLTTGMMDRQRLLGWMQQEVQQNGAALVPDSFTFYVMER